MNKCTTVPIPIYYLFYFIKETLIFKKISGAVSTNTVSKRPKFYVPFSFKCIMEITHSDAKRTRMMRCHQGTPQSQKSVLSKRI
jgi:hypothetical protein